MPAVYLASPLGFSPEWKGYRERIKQRLIEVGCVVFDPWAKTLFHGAIGKARAITDWPARIEAFRTIAQQIGKSNHDMILACDIVLGVLDGTEVDSGVASEIGFGAGSGKRCYGLRTDFRDCGDFVGIPVNLQVLYWIEESGGRLFRRIDEIRFRPL